MLEELRSNPRSPAARFRVRCPGQSAAIGDRKVDPRFSTGFAERARRRSTAALGPIHSAGKGEANEEVVA